MWPDDPERKEREMVATFFALIRLGAALLREMKACSRELPSDVAD